MKFSTAFIAATEEFSTFEKQIPAPAFRRSFSLPRMDRAELTVCGLGLYELFVNGRRITKGHLSSYIANPDDILYYDNYDLAPYLNEGENVIGVLLGNGMLNSFGGQVWEFEKARYRSAPKLALTFEGEGEDGAVEFDATAGFVCTESPIFLDDLRIGEFYDATKELGDWTALGYDASDWREPIPAEPPRGECRICDVDPILPTKELAPVSIRPGCIAKHFEWLQPLMAPLGEEMMFGYPEGEECDDGYLYDFGVNAAGVCRIHIKNAKPGQKIIIQFGEALAEAEDGREGLDLRSMMFLPRRYDHRCIYICKGGDEIYTPSFTYYGFRYALVCGITKEQATSDLLTYVVMNTALRTRSTFRCSDETVNKLWDAAITADLANFYHFPTDCPHREKNGWTGDASNSAEQMVMALTPERNWRQWLDNIRAAMRENGAIPGIVPTGGWGFDWGNGPGWDSVLVSLPYYAYIYRGNLDLAKDNAAAILRYINYITTRRDELGLIHIGLGDWCPPAGDGIKAPLEFTDTVICIDFCRKAAVLFDAMGMTAQKVFAETVGNELLAAARAHLLAEEPWLTKGCCQTTQAMGIYYDIFEEEHKEKAFAQLLSLIEEHGNTFDCGIFGCRALFHVLSDYGRADLAHKLIVGPEYPSFGYQIAQGATALWEQCIPEGDPPVSFNHHFYGDIISWFMKNLAGIVVNPKGDDPTHIRLSPKFINAIHRVEATHDSICGKLTVSWKRENGEITYSYDIPAGLTVTWETDNRPLSGRGEIRIRMK